MKTKDKIIDVWIEVKLRIERGMQHLNFPKNLIALMLLSKTAFPQITLVQLSVFGILTIIAVFLVGLLDINYLQLLQKENDKMSFKYNKLVKRE